MWWKRISIGVLLIVLLAILLAAYDTAGQIAWIGSFPLDVVAQPVKERPIRRAWFDTLAVPEDFITRLRDKPELAEVEATWTPLDDPRAGSFRIDVQCIGKDSAFGRPLSYGQHNVLALKFEFMDGETLYRAVQIPKQSGEDRVTIDLP
jgi:hypothetical protein